MFQKVSIFMWYCMFLAYFHNGLLVNAYIPPPHSLNLHTLPRPSKPPHSSPSHLPRIFQPTYPPCPAAAKSPKYASLCILQFSISASNSTPVPDTETGPLTLGVFGPSCNPPLFILPSLPLDKNISVNADATRFVGDLFIQMENKTWYNEIWYQGERVDLRLPEDEEGRPYFPEDFEGGWLGGPGLSV